MQTQNERLLVKVSEAATMLRLSTKTIYRMIERETLPHVRIGSTYRIPYDGLRAWVADPTPKDTGNSILTGD